MSGERMRTARQMFLEHRGDHGGMRFNEVLRAYTKLNVTKAQEREWALERERWLIGQIRETPDRVTLMIDVEELIQWIRRYDDGSFLTTLLDILHEREDLLDALERLMVAELLLFIVRGGHQTVWAYRSLALARRLIQSVLDGPIQLHGDAIPGIDFRTLTPTSIRKRAERDVVQFQNLR